MNFYVKNKAILIWQCKEINSTFVTVITGQFLLNFALKDEREKYLLSTPIARDESNVSVFG
jgi:hypothetical protein